MDTYIGYMTKLAEEGLKASSTPLSKNAVKLLMEMTEVGIDITDNTKYKINMETCEFERIEEDEEITGNILN